MLKKVEKKGFKMVCICFILACLLTILSINFSRNPAFYDTDMYSDMIYAQQAWRDHSLFPDGWVFGNQVYVVATPVLAALFYGITEDSFMAMGLASTVMALLILASFYWMLKPLPLRRSSRVCCLAAFMAVTLFAHDPIYETRGWQLLFTLCSYYSCYLITLFLAFGCVLRRDAMLNGRGLVILAVICMLSLGTGMQSLRQTAVMVCPLLAVEFLRLGYDIVSKRNIRWRSFVPVGAIILCNLAGVLIIRSIPVPQHEIFGEIRIEHPLKMVKKVILSVNKAASLLVTDDSILKLAGGAACLLLMAVGVIWLVFRKQEKILTILFLFVSSIGAIFAIDIMTTMGVRNIYFFQLFPLFALTVAFLYELGGEWMRRLIAIGMVLLMILGIQQGMIPALTEAYGPDPYEEVADMLEEKGIRTIYANWNEGEEIALASDGAIRAGFWAGKKNAFVRVNYLCNPDVFDADPSVCAYVFFGKEKADIGVQKAAEENAEFSLLAYYPEYELYIYVSDQMLMKNETE